MVQSSIYYLCKQVICQLRFIDIKMNNNSSRAVARTTTTNAICNNEIERCEIYIWMCFVSSKLDFNRTMHGYVIEFAREIIVWVRAIQHWITVEYMHAQHTSRVYTWLTANLYHMIDYIHITLNELSSS